MVALATHIERTARMVWWPFRGNGLSVIPFSCISRYLTWRCDKDGRVYLLGAIININLFYGSYTVNFLFWKKDVWIRLEWLQHLSFTYIRPCLWTQCWSFIGNFLWRSKTPILCTHLLLFEQFLDSNMPMQIQYPSASAFKLHSTSLYNKPII